MTVSMIEGRNIFLLWRRASTHYTLFLNGCRRLGYISDQSVTSAQTLLVAWPACLAFFCVSRLCLALIGMFGRVEDVDGELEKNCSLQEGGHPCVKLWRERNENARPLEPTFVGWPVVAVFVPLFRPRPFLQG
jgi:hypothetical protein